MFLGNILAGVVSGPVYQKTSDLVSFVREEAGKINLQLPEQLNLVNFGFIGTNAFHDRIPRRIQYTSVKCYRKMSCPY